MTKLPPMIDGKAIYDETFKEKVMRLQSEDFKTLYENEYSRIEKMEGGFDAKKNRPVPYRFQVLFDFMKDGESVLDVGCNDGYLGYLINENFPNVEFNGVDISEKAVKQCEGNVDGNFKQLDIEDGKIDGFYDKVFLFEILEHLKKPEDVLRKCFAAVRPGGRLFFTVPIEKNVRWYTHLHEFDYVKVLELCEGVSDKFFVYRIPKMFEKEGYKLFFVEVVKK